MPADVRSAFKDRGVYVITGGLGSLGVLFAREILAQTSAAKRRPHGSLRADSERNKALDELFSGTARVSYRPMDLERPRTRWTRVIESIRGELGGLNGILHCAGMIAD